MLIDVFDSNMEFSISVPYKLQLYITLFNLAALGVTAHNAYIHIGYTL